MSNRLREMSSEALIDMMSPENLGDPAQTYRDRFRLEEAFGSANRTTENGDEPQE